MWQRSRSAALPYPGGCREQIHREDVPQRPSTTRGMVTGEPHEPVRHTWGEVHERARRIAGGLAAAGVGPGDAVGVLAGFPVEIAPTAQGLWMRGASLTMLHQPTPRTDLVVWAEDTMTVIGMIEAKAVIVSEPFLVAIPVLEEKGIKVLTVTDLLAADPIDPIEVGEDDLALMQLTSGSTGSPKGRADHPPQHLLQRRGDVHRRRVRRRQATSWSAGCPASTTWAWSAS